mgnify:FL=1
MDAAIASLPAEPSGHYLVAARPAVLGKKSAVVQPEAWYAVQDTTVYPLSEEELVSLLDDPKVTLDVFDSAPLYARAMAAGSWGSSIVWDGKLAAYLLDASASKYQVGELVPSYKAAAAFTCVDYPDAGRLADLFAKMKAEITACGEDALYNDIEFPLAQVLADMTRIGVLVDRDRSVLRAGGYLIQLLPGAPDGVIDRLEKGIMAAGPVTNLLMENDDPESLLRRVMKDFELEILETVPVEYRCYCSRERMAAALVSLGRKQLTELAEDPNGIELTCQFCDSRQRFTPEEIRELLEKASEA